MNCSNITSVTFDLDETTVQEGDLISLGVYYSGPASSSKVIASISPPTSKIGILDTGELELKFGPVHYTKGKNKLYLQSCSPKNWDLVENNGEWPIDTTFSFGFFVERPTFIGSTEGLITIFVGYIVLLGSFFRLGLYFLEKLGLLKIE